MLRPMIAITTAIAVDVVPSELLGPTAALAGALVIVAVLWRENRRVDKERIDDLKAQIVARTAERDRNASGWEVQTMANAKLAEAWEARNQVDAERERRGRS